MANRKSFVPFMFLSHLSGVKERRKGSDRFSRDMFVKAEIPQSAANVWAVEVLPGRAFAYELRRPGRFFRVVFDLAEPVDAPPAPWGAQAP